MTTIHLLGSEGFIGRAVQRQARGIDLHCWSHRHSKLDQHFDLLEPSSWKSLIKQCPSSIILLSWPGLPNYQETFHVTRNLPACIELVEKLISAGLKRIIVAGTCYEYGLQNGPLNEEQMTNPMNCYSVAKDSLRRVLSCLCEQKGVQWAWLRIFYPYGVGQNPQSLLPSLVHAIEANEASFAIGSGRQIRDFVPVEEVALQLLTMAVSRNASGIYNGGSGISCSILEIVERTIATYESDIKIKRGVYPDRADEPLAFWAEMGKFRALQSQL